MAELFLLVLGLIGSLVMALLKGLAVISVGWLACLIPLGIALVLILIIHGGDIGDIDFN